MSICSTNRPQKCSVIVFVSFLLHEYEKTYLGSVLPPVGGNWQLILPKLGLTNAADVIKIDVLDE
jgi:hypothetical protein